MNVSVCIATYGNSEWEVMAEERAYPSAHAQEPFEVLMFHDPEGTIASVRNELGKTARGDWLCFLDADDELAPNYLGAMRRALERGRRSFPGPFLLMPAVSYIYPRNRRRATMMSPIKDLTVDNFLVVGTLIERETFLAVDGFSDYPHGFEDWSLWAKAWHRSGAKIVQVPEAVYIAYVNPDSEHRRRWKDRPWQVDMHRKVQAELFG